MSESKKHVDPQESVLEIIRSYYPDLTEKEFEVCRNVTITMWDFHADSADYEEVVARWPNVIYLEPKPNLHRSLFTDEDEYRKMIASLVVRGVLAESLYVGNDDRFRNDRVLTFSRNNPSQMEIQKFEHKNYLMLSIYRDCVFFRIFILPPKQRGKSNATEIFGCLLAIRSHCTIVL
jgi:hypothetical protein